MIELIFVIVIIGILAAVAIPKLSATRDDAKISAIVANTRTLAEDVKNYYTSQGEANYLIALVTDVTDVPLFKDAACATQATSADVFATTVAGGGLFICDDSADVLDITGTVKAPIAITLKQGASTSTINAALTKETTFQALTDGTTGKTTTLGGQKVKR
jgi:general secretion pathway protein G